MNPAACDVDAPAIDGASPAPPAKIRIGDAALLGVIGAAAGLAATVARTKVTALVLGPAGIGKAAQILQVVASVNVPVAVFTGPALVKVVAEARRRGDPDAIARVVRTSTTIILGLSLLGCALSLLLGRAWLPEAWGPAAWPLVLLAAVAALLSAWATIPQQVLTAHTQLKQLAALRLAIAFIGVALTCAATYLFGLPGQFLALALAAAITLPLALLVTRRTLALPWAPTLAIDRSFVKSALVLGSSALAASYALNGATMMIQRTLERHGGSADIGQFQAAWAIGATYFGILLDGVGTYVTPRYAAVQTSRELAEEIDNAARFVFRVVPPALLAAIVLRRVAVRALYDHRFDAAIELVGLQMVADMCKTISWVQAGPLLYRNKVRAFLVVELSGWLALALGAVLLVPRYGLLGVGYAYLGMNVGYTIFSAVVVAKACDVPLDLQRVARTLLFTAGAFAVLVLDRAFAATRWVALAVALVWLHRAGVLQSIFHRLAGRLAAVRGRAPAEKP